MNLDLSTLFESGAIDFFRGSLMSMMRSELAICASGSSTEEDQKAYNRLASCLVAEIEFNGFSIKANAGIDESKLPAEFVQKNRGLIDLVNSNFDKKNQFALEMCVEDQLDLESVRDHIANYYILPYFDSEELQHMLGGS